MFRTRVSFSYQNERNEQHQPSQAQLIDNHATLQLTPEIISNYNEDSTHLRMHGTNNVTPGR